MSDFPNPGELKRRSIGPTNTSVMLGFERPEVFLHVRWDARLDRVRDYAREHDEFECRARWAVIEPSHRKGRAFALEVEWPDLPDVGGIVLFFEPGEWEAELHMIRNAGGFVSLVAQGAQGADILHGAIAIETPADDILTEWLI